MPIVRLDKEKSAIEKNNYSSLKVSNIVENTFDRQNLRWAFSLTLRVILIASVTFSGMCNGIRATYAVKEVLLMIFVKSYGESYGKTPSSLSMGS